MPRYRVLQTPVFEGLVEELIDGLGDCDRDIPSNPAVRHHGTPLWTIDSVTADGTNTATRTSPYIEDQDAIDAQVLPTDLPIDAESIFVELGLCPGLTAEQIAGIRRRFAMRNHPDKFPIALQRNATERMMIANALCDGYPLTIR